MLLAGPVAAQVVERHLPPDTAPAQAPARIDGAATPPEADDRPIGPTLIAIALLSADEPVAGDAGPGVRLGHVSPPRARRLIRRLTPFLARRLSRKLIADVVATVIRSYRAAGRPFVSVTTPEQELTGGTLSLRVVEFRAARLVVHGSSVADAARVARRLRFPAGAPIDAPALRQDLAWLDRYPFRGIGTVFAAGERPGTTDLTVTATPTRRWRAFAGIGSSDAPSSGDARYFAGAVIGGVIGPDSIVSAQATTSGFDDPAYLGLAGRLVAPLGPRRELTLLAVHVRGHATAAPFSSRTATVQGSLDLRFALPAMFAGDGRVGVEAGRQVIDARFGDVPIYRLETTTLAVFAGYGAAARLPGGSLSVELALHFSPGGIGRGNGADRLFFGRPGGGSATYAYLTADVSGDHRLGPLLVWQGRLILQASGTPLPPLDQIGLGGSGYVRGYTLDDGGYDSAAILRNGLVLMRRAGVQRFSPCLLADIGRGRYHGRAPDRTFASIGLGGDRTFGNGARLHLDAALPLIDGVRTVALRPRIMVNVQAGL